MLITLLCAVSLVLVGLIFGLNVQINDSTVEFINSISSMVAAVAAAVAALATVYSLKSWKNEFTHTRLYESILALEGLLWDFFTDYECLYSDENFGHLEVVSASSGVRNKYQKEFEKHYSEISYLSAGRYDDQLKFIDITVLTIDLERNLLLSKSSRTKVDDYYEKFPTDHRPFRQIPIVKKNLRAWMDSKRGFFKIRSDSIRTIQKIRNSL